MSHLDDLIKELCPNEVPVEHLANLASYTRGVTYGKSDEEPEGPIQVLRSNNITLSSNTLNFDDVKHVSSAVKVRQNQRLYKNDILISAASGSKAHVGKVAYIFEDLPNTVFGGFMAVLRTKGILEARFLFHLMVGRSFSEHLDRTLSTTTINNLNATIVGSFLVPVPPLEVQREIVRILDQFTQLEAELEAELDARRRQYDFHRTSLLTKNPDGACIPLGELADFKYGYTARAADTGKYRFIRITDISPWGKLSPEGAKYVDLPDAAEDYVVKPGDLLMARTGATFGKTMIFESAQPAVYASFLICIRFKSSIILPAYYWHFAQSSLYWSQANAMVSTGGQPQFNANVLKQVMVPVPPLEEQALIIDTLGRFDALVNDLSSGLPAEITARRKQYEYYRDRLLTFEEAAA